MNKVVHKLILDMKSIISQQSIEIHRYDTGRKLLISFVDDGNFYPIGEECKAVLKVETQNGEVLSADCVIEEDCVEFDLSSCPEVSAEEGEEMCQLCLYGADGVLISSPVFSIVIYDFIGWNEDEGTGG